MIGSEGAVCVYAEKSSGIVYVADNTVKCATCKKSNCQHVVTINTLTAEPDRPLFLDVFVSCLESCGIRLPKKQTLSTLSSWKPISFDTPADISHAFTQTRAERFHIQEGVCYLRDKHSTNTCKSCGGPTIEKERLSCLVTRNQVLQAKGISWCLHIHTHINAR